MAQRTGMDRPIFDKQTPFFSVGCRFPKNKTLGVLVWEETCRCDVATLYLHQQLPCARPHVGTTSSMPAMSELSEARVPGRCSP